MTRGQTWLEQHLETTADTEFFWSAGHTGQLQILACNDCSYFIHPPAPHCPLCVSSSVEPQAVSGRATLYSYTQLAHSNAEKLPIIAIVELDEQQDLRFMTNLVGTDIADVQIGMPVEVDFRFEGQLAIPIFKAAP